MKFKTYFKDLIDPKIIIGVLIILAVAIIITVFFTSKVSSFKQKYKNKYIAYLIVTILIFALITFIGSSEVFNGDVYNIFTFYQTIFFILGIIHCYIYRSYFKKFDTTSIWIELLFNLIILIYSIIPIIIIYTIVKGNVFVYSMAFSTLTFLVPTLIYATFESCISIPPKIYKTWEFPDEHAYPDPPDSEYRDMLVVTFLFHKDPNSTMRTEFRAKAPIRMDFGRLFYHFVNDYNLKNPDFPINLLDKTGQKQHWVFYLKSKHLGIPKYIQPKYPLYMNKIEENSVIICERTPPLLNSVDEINYEINEDQIEKEENKLNHKKENF